MDITKYAFIALCVVCTNALAEESSACLGNTQLPSELADEFDAVDNPSLLQAALGEPGLGKLCQGATYQRNAEGQVTIYRAWNSTNPGSKLGNWWAYDQPSGLVTDYREEYAICYQWSPLDKLVRCTLKPGANVVIGTGQSAKCSEYLTYPVSDTQQIFIENAADVVTDCEVADGEFDWD